METLEKKQNPLRKTIKHWNISLISFSYNLNGQIRARKRAPLDVLTNQEDETIATCILNMQKCGPFIIYHNSNLEVIETKPTPFLNEIFRNI
jgi:hypothetical protein